MVDVFTDGACGHVRPSQYCFFQPNLQHCYPTSKHILKVKFLVSCNVMQLANYYVIQPSSQVEMGII